MSEGGWANVLFVCIKVFLVMGMMIFGMVANYAKSNAQNHGTGEVNPIFRLFMYWVFILVLLCLYEFSETFKTIRFLYIMLLLGGMAQIRGVHIFIDKASHYHKDPQTTRNMTNVVLVAYAAHILLLGLVNDADMGAFCVKDSEYPKCLVMYLFVWLLCFVFVAVFKYNNFYMDEEEMRSKDARELALEEKLLEVGTEEDRRMMDQNDDGILDKLQQDKDGDGEYDAVITNSKIINLMLDRFFLFHCFFVIYVIALLIAAFRINGDIPTVDYLRCELTEESDQEAYTCAEGLDTCVLNDQIWEPSKIGGKLISLAHVIMVMMGSVQAEQAFYTVPHKIGYYNTQDLDIIEGKVKEGQNKNAKNQNLAASFTDKYMNF